MEIPIREQGDLEIRTLGRVERLGRVECAGVLHSLKRRYGID